MTDLIMLLGGLRTNWNFELEKSLSGQNLVSYWEKLDYNASSSADDEGLNFEASEGSLIIP